MQKLTKEQFEQLNEPEKHEKSLHRLQNSVCKHVYDWQEEQGLYAWDSEALNEANPDLTLTESFLIERAYTPKGKTLTFVPVQFFADPTTDENDGVFGDYRLTNLKDNLYRLDHKPKDKPKDKED